jgi:hypothetical protein
VGPYFTELQKTVGKLGSVENQMWFYRQEQETYFEHVYLSSYLGFKLVEEVIY